jgi:hypothetical protein
MDEQELKSLLRRADATASPPRTATDLGPRVRRLAWRRRVVATTGRFAIAASLALLAGTAAWWFVDGRRDAPDEAPAIAKHARPSPEAERLDPDALRAQVARLEADAASRLAAVDAFRARRAQRARLAALQQQLTRPDPLASTRLELEKTACFLVREADRMCASKGKSEACINAYERVVRLFPKTNAAVQAQQKITEIQTGKGGLS